MKERIVYTFNSSEVTFTEKFIEKYKSIFEKKSFDKPESSYLFYILTHNNIGNIFSFLDRFNECRFTSSIYGRDCKIFLRKFSEGSMPKKIYFNDIIPAGKRNRPSRKDDSKERRLNHLEGIIENES